jgi:hypothetical protein
MLKKCYVLNSKIINVGDWNFQIEPFEVEPAELDEEGNIIKDAVFGNRITNPLPEGVTVEEREFEYSFDNGWRDVGYIPVPSETEILKQQVADLQIALALVLGV